ncbi:MAG: ankyrin repeat domain-containing protein [Vicinamibacterales bacterium]|nr:ankyrin repeat domain-containing protein [Vicinamibacterales bacterium]
MALILAMLLALSPLIEAIRSGDVEGVRALVASGTDVNAAEGDGATALHWAAYENDEALVETLLAAGARVAAANDLGITPLHLASANGHLAIVSRLLARGAAVEAASEAGVTPLMEAARSGNADVVRALLARGANPNTRESARQQTALMWAAGRRHHEAVTALVEGGADVDARTSVRTLTVMLDRGPRRTVKTSMQDAHPLGTGGGTALHFAAQSGDTPSARTLLAAGAGVNVAAADGRTPLVLAAFSGHGEIARALIEAGADVHADAAGYTALHAATLRGDLATVRALLARGASPNARLTRGSPVRRFGSQWAFTTPMTGGTPLLVAATYLEVEILTALLAAGADPDVPLDDGTTPLLAAAGIPVEKEARPTDLERWQMVDSDNPPVPRDEADALEAVRQLIAAGADVTRANEAGDTALHAAAGAGLVPLIRILAEAGAVLDATNANGQTPLDLTLPRPPAPGRGPGAPGHPEAAELLRTLAAPRL